MAEIKDNAPEPIHLMFVGDTGVGKTVFLHRYVTGEFKSHFIPTIGVDFLTKDMEFYENAEDEEMPIIKVALQLWDTAGQERYKSLTRAFYRDAKGFILLFDVTKRSSFSTLQRWLDDIYTCTATTHPQVVLCGNKVDLEAQRQVDEITALKRANELGLTYFETSVETGQNINEAMDCLVHMVLTGKIPREGSDDVMGENGDVKEIEKSIRLEAVIDKMPEEKKKRKCAC